MMPGTSHVVGHVSGTSRAVLTLAPREVTRRLDRALRFDRGLRVDRALRSDRGLRVDRALRVDPGGCAARSSTRRCRERGLRGRP
jgi:hypothetical protein